MSRFKQIAAAIFAAAVLSGCGGLAGGGILVKAPQLNVPFETDIKIQAGELEMTGNMKRYGTGIWEMIAASPETLAGLEISYNADEGVKAELDGLSLDIPAEDIRDGAVFARIFKAMDSAAAAGELSCTDTQDGRVFSGDSYSITFDPESLMPTDIEIPSYGITGEFENFRILTEETAVTETADSGTENTAE